MNIFILDSNIKKSVEYYTDKHCVKMILEYCQMLCTTVSVNQDIHNRLSIISIPYIATHKNHPCTKWVVKNYDNFAWLSALTHELHKEYYHRYGRQHLSYTKLRENKIIDDDAITHGQTLIIEELHPAIVMPDECKTNSVVESYRNYYRLYKQQQFAWRNRQIPFWLELKVIPSQ